MDRRRHAGATAKCVFQVNWTAVFFQEIAKRFVSNLLKVLHLVTAEKIDLPPDFLIELYPLAGHQLAFLWRACERDGFLAARVVDRDEARRAAGALPPAVTLWRSASMRLMTFEGARSFGR